MKADQFTFGRAQGEQQDGAFQNFELWYDELCELLGPNKIDFTDYADCLEAVEQHIFDEESAVAFYHRGFELFNLCYGILVKNPSIVDHPFYGTALAYMAAHPLSTGDAVTRANVYYVALYGAFIDAAVSAHLANAERAAREVVSFDVFARVRARLVDLLGDDAPKLAHFEAAKQRLTMPMPLFQGFLSEATDRLVQALNHTDEGTKMPVYQILLEYNLLPPPCRKNDP